MIVTHRLDIYDVICGNCGYRYDETEEGEYLISQGKDTLLFFSTCPKCNTTAKLELK